MPKIIVSLSEDENTKLEQYKVVKKLSSKEKAIQKLINELNISITVSQ